MNTRTHSQSWHEVRTGARQCGGCADRHPVSCGQPRSFSILFLPPSTPPLQGASTFSDSVILRLSFLGETRFRDTLQIPALTSYTFESRKTRRPARLFSPHRSPFSLLTAALLSFISIFTQSLLLPDLLKRRGKLDRIAVHQSSEPEDLRRQYSRANAEHGE